MGSSILFIARFTDLNTDFQSYEFCPDNGNNKPILIFSSEIEGLIDNKNKKEK